MKKLLLLFLILCVVAAAIAAYFGWLLFSPAFENKTAVTMRIRSGWTLSTLGKQLKTKAGLKNEESFATWVYKLGYQKVKPCTITIPAKCSLYEIAEILKENRYQTVDITILGSMNLERLAKVLSDRIEINADSFVSLVKHSKNLYQTGFDSSNWQSLCLPNTYNFTAATTMNGFVNRMEKEYVEFWNIARRIKADKQGITPLQASILASIVTKESNQTTEYENIAGVYLNRLRKGMLLQADPTVAFARGSEGRILAKDLEIDSRYNTYKYLGLPPGPLCIPNLSAIEAVLNYKQHEFLYFVAHYTLNGSHHFSKNLKEHEIWANKYRNAARTLRLKQNN